MRPLGPITGGPTTSPLRSVPSVTAPVRTSQVAKRVEAPCWLRKMSAVEVAFQTGVNASSSNALVSARAGPPAAGATQSSSLSTCLARSELPAHAIHLPSGDHCAPPLGIASSLRIAPPVAATTARSLRLPSSTVPVGFQVNASERESGDQRGSETMNVPDVTRVCLPVARSSVQRWLYCVISSSTT